MDWQIVVAIIISIGAVLAFFAMGEDPDEPKAVPERRAQGLDPDPAQSAPPARFAPPVPQTPPADRAIVDRFMAALRAENERSRDGA